MSDRTDTFLRAVLEGRALISDVDDWVDAWHDAPAGNPEAELELHEFLGLPLEDYNRWVKHPESLRFAVAATRRGVSVASVLKAVDASGVAARAEDAGAAQRVLELLARQGLVGPAPRGF